MIFDLHCHSTASDGVLSPAALVTRAHEQGVDVLALTDHDDLRGHAEAAATAQRLGIRYVPGVEVSVTWGGQTVHVVGLNIDPENPQLLAGLAANRSGRAERARRMAEALARLGIVGALEGAYAYAENKALIGRTHFARFLVEEGYVKDVKTVFKKYLVKGKPGYVPHEWVSLPAAVEWIRAAGGQAVLAHPGRTTSAARRCVCSCRSSTTWAGWGWRWSAAATPRTRCRSMPRWRKNSACTPRWAQTSTPPARVVASWAARPLPAGCRPLWETW